METKIGIKTGVMYCRVSTRKQMENGDSLEAQELACCKSCELKGIKPLVAAFKDAFSGKSSDRPQLNAAIQYAILHKADYFVIYDIDRFSREGYSSYRMLKDKLASHGITLIDSKNVIGESRMAVQNETYDLGKYKWAKENPTEMAEMVYSATAEIEGKKILQRTIPQAIFLAQQGFWVRGPIIGFKNARVKFDGKKRTVLESHPIESPWLIRMYELRAEGILPDEDIVREVNGLGYRSGKHGIELTVKMMQAYIKKPIYAGILVEEWTNHKPVKAQFPGLVSLDTWNKANRGKYKLLELGNNEFQLLDGKCQDFQPDLGRRKKYDPDLPYRNLIKSSMLPGQFITGSRSRNKRGNLFPYYHPLRQKGRVGENISKKEFENIVNTFFQDIRVDDFLKQLFLERFDLIFEAQKSELLSRRSDMEQRLKTIKESIKSLQERACTVDQSYDLVLQGINEQLQTKDIERQTLENQLQDLVVSGVENHRNFQQLCLYFIEHLGELLTTSQNLEEKRIVFQFVFTEIPTFQEVVNRTPKVYPIFASASQQKNSREGILEENMFWQGGSESN